MRKTSLNLVYKWELPLKLSFVYFLYTFFVVAEIVERLLQHK